MWFWLVLLVCCFRCGEMDTSSPDIHTLVTRLQTLERQNDDKDKKYSSMMSTIIASLTSATTELSSLKTRLSSVEAENHSLREELTLIKHQTNATKERCDNLKDIFELNVTELASNVSEMESELTSVNRQISLTNSECVTCKSNLTRRISFEHKILANEQVSLNRISLMKSQLLLLSAHVSTITAAQRWTNASVSKMNKTLTTVKNAFTDVKLKTDAVRVKLAERNKYYAFEADLSSQHGRHFTILPSTVIKMKHIITNHGGAYNRTSGVMIAPKHGLYMFWFRINAVFSGDNSTRLVTAQIRSDRKVLTERYTRTTESHVTGQIGGFVVTSLFQGEQVWLTCDSRIIFSGHDSISSFGGILLKT